MTDNTYNPGKGAGQPVGVAILGLGTVGQQVLRLLQERAEDFERRIGGPVEIKGVAVRDKSKPRPGVDPELLTDDAFTLVERDDVDLVVEVIGGIDYPRRVVLKALGAGKSVVTANKALVAACGAELSEATEAAGADLFFEAAVAAAIPVVGPLRRSLAGDQVNKVVGIVNGTTNFILDAMDSTGADYDEMLAEATRLGYAEADPTADVGGHDAASKAAILSSLAFHTRVTADDVHCEGITEITAADFDAAKEADCTIKLLAICERVKADDGSEGVSARVYPALVPRRHPLATVHESFNAVFVEADAAGRLMFYGRGAGGNPTASAVLGDIVAAARNKVHGGRAPGDSTYANLPILEFGDVETRYHIDLHVDDRLGVLADIARVFADRGISLRTVRQEGANPGARLVIITHKAREAELRDTVEALKQQDAVLAINSVIRIEGMDA
ncbi:homoserine dehydrogenase [Corynebacterium sp.]|uniref:homoserine dehydrogenase n=1 Tax=Corynebacterium sp. TaxID=1720 RepID=UPI0026DCA84D|nr:homoserine dehydrogenase [Corynebacterium sp.]MDO4610143.1 homoserine dehydrogenase [Corynebacterium sp.]